MIQINAMTPRTEAGRGLLAGLIRQGMPIEAVSDAIYSIEAEAGMGHELCSTCGHRQRTHGPTDSTAIGCWEKFCTCKLGRPFA